jgi:hypothetical protein
MARDAVEQWLVDRAWNALGSALMLYIGLRRR